MAHTGKPATNPYTGGHSSWLLMRTGSAGMAAIGKVKPAGGRSLPTHATGLHYIKPRRDAYCVFHLIGNVPFTISCPLFRARLLIAAFSTI